ncbi:tetratricopeptide repeat protein [Liberibacter sp. Z1]|nr:tetratricopeptide repeat protein [Candidatus Liberibacter sp.]
MLGTSCSSLKYSNVSAYKVELLENMSYEQLLGVADKIGNQYQSNPKNKKVGIAYADVLRRVGRSKQALAVMQQIIIQNPNDRSTLSEYGKALAAAGYLEEALAAIERAQTPDMPDWKLISAKASILSQMGRYHEARTQFNNALDFAPNEPSILSNMAMSYLLEGNIQKSEENLRIASAMQGANSSVRQNLALVVGLQGRIKEAYTIAQQDLSPEAAARNMSYLKSTLSHKDYWKKIREKDQRLLNVQDIK